MTYTIKEINAHVTRRYAELESLHVQIPNELEMLRDCLELLDKINNMDVRTVAYIDPASRIRVTRLMVDFEELRDLILDRK